MQETLHVIIGPTAAGKSSLAMFLAKERSLAIISADSRQVYRGFDIGTAKPSARDRKLVPHFGIDVVGPTERYSAAAWARDAMSWLAAAGRLTHGAVVVGGTGFYIRALIRPIAGVAAPADERRDSVYAWLSREPVAELRRWCRRLDPSRAHLGKTQLIRAIETVLLNGVRLSDHYGITGTNFSVRYLVVDPEAQLLAARIERRVHEMIAAGWPDEARNLLRAVPRDAIAWNACGYREIRRYVEGEIDLAQAVQLITTATRQYAKRQRTWIRHQLHDGEVTFLDPLCSDAPEKAVAWWDDGEPRKPSR